MARKKNILAWDEIEQKMIPQTVGYTTEEEAEADTQEQETILQPPTDEERISAMEDVILEIIGGEM